MPAKVHPAAPREVHGCGRFWKRAGAEFPALGVWPLGPRPAGGGVWGHSVGSPVRRTGNRRKPGSARGLRGPQGPLGIPPGHPRRWLGLSAFLALFFWPTGGVPAPEGQNSDFRRSGRNRGSMGLERCGPEPPDGPFGWPHSRFGRARYLISDPPFGLWGCSTTTIGQNPGRQGFPAKLN